MAGSRPRVRVISRGTGGCATAAAAYRAAEMILDERTGRVCDYRRKGGVEHTEIMAPENTPEWMHDRAQLWNAVERIETRTNSQLAREIMLPLPHELDAGARLEMVRSFAAEQFVAQGMIADIAIHAPHRDGDQRNHHAHIMLTMRELTGEGFATKKATPRARSWNDQKNVERWVAEWEQVQNVALERAGLDVRVNFTSFEAQGLDREAEQHEGPAATALRRQGKESRVAAANDNRRDRNSRTADLTAERLRLQMEIERERDSFAAWVAEKRGMLERAQELRQLDLVRRQELESDALEARLVEIYGRDLRTVEAEAAAVAQRLERKGMIGFTRRMFGFTKSDTTRLDLLKKTIDATHTRMNEMRGRLREEHDREKDELARVQKERRDQQQQGFDRAAERKKWQISAKQAHLDAVTERAAARERPDLRAAPERKAEPEPVRRRSLDEKRRDDAREAMQREYERRMAAKEAKAEKARAEENRLRYPTTVRRSQEIAGTVPPPLPEAERLNRPETREQTGPARTIIEQRRASLEARRAEQQRILEQERAYQAPQTPREVDQGQGRASTPQDQQRATDAAREAQQATQSTERKPGLMARIQAAEEREWQETRETTRDQARGGGDFFAELERRGEQARREAREAGQEQSQGITRRGPEIER